VRLTSTRGTLTRPLIADPTVPVGVAVMPFAADGTGPALFIDVNEPVTDLRVETLK
jgi:hypothetical protein